MLSNNRGRHLTAGAVLFLAACGGGEGAPGPVTSAPVAAGPVAADRPQVSDEATKVGAPYQMGGVTYTPADVAGYDEVGYAGWYGAEQDGGNTANGEPFVANAITAAHRTLPLPSYVEVTSLDTGKTILVRVNDRGPFASDRLIDLSQGAAEQLGILGDGHAPVRVRRVNPPDQDKAILRAQGRAAERMETPPALLNALRGKLKLRPVAIAASTPKKPLPPQAVTAARPPEMGGRKSDGAAAGVDFKVEGDAAQPVRPVPSPAAPGAPHWSQGGGYVVQVAAFSTRERAQALAGRIGASVMEGNGVWRVRFGPYPSEAAAQAGVRQAAAKGFENARIMANDAP